MQALVQALDWSKTALGGRESWPQSLRTTVMICLESTFPMAVWWGPGRVQIYNDAFRAFMGRKHPRSLGQDAAECWAEIWPVTGPLCDHVRTHGQATWSTDLLLEMHRHGYLEETYFTFSYSPIRDESGGIGGVLVTCCETTAQIIGARRLVALRDLGALSSRATTAEQACSLAAEVLERHTIDVPYAAIWLLDERGRAVRAGHSGGIGEHPSFPLELDVATVCGPFEEALRRREPVVVTDVRARAGDLPGGPWPCPPEEGVVLPIGGSGSEPLVGVIVAGVSPRRRLDRDGIDFLRLVAGHIASNVASARAYDAERRRAEALAELDRAKTAFFGNVSHEFRTPLTLMMGTLEELLSDGAGPLSPEQRDRAHVAHRNSLRLLRLVNTLLDFSRIEAGRGEPSIAPIDLAALTADIASNFRSTLERAGLAFEVACDPLPELIWADADLWEKVVLNLLSNAFKFTFAGSISVRLTWHDGAVLEVTDSGVGIPEADLPRLFTRFHRVRGQASRTYEGTGIGLALVHELVKLHGGAIEVRSQVDRGTTFRVTLPPGSAHHDGLTVAPRARTDAGARTFVEEAERWLPESEPIDAAPADPTSRVLVADDNADMRAYLARLLAKRWSVEAVANGEDALAAARRERPTVVLSDVMMPRMDGFELLRALRADPATADVPVVLLSARAGEESRVDGLDAGADDYLVKPFGARELLARVGAQVERVRTQQRARVEEDRLWQAQRMEAVGTLAGGVAHEVNNMMTAVIGFGEYALRHATPDNPLRAEINEMVNAGRHAAQVTRQLLAFSRRQVLDPEVLDVNAVVGDVARMLTRMLGEDIALTLVLRARPGTIEADRGQLEQVLVNVALNARDAMPHGGRLTIRTEDTKRSGVWTRVQVEDTGVGMDDATRTRAFEPFFTTKPVGRGTGLGLSTVFGIVTQSGGRVRLESQPGQGTRVLMEFPTVAAVPVSVSAPLEPARGGTETVLLVEDEDVVRRLASRVLAEAGFSVLEARGGHEALARIDASPDVRIVLTDLVMPEMSGRELGRAIRARRPDLPVLYMSGYSGDQLERQGALERGAPFLQKPFAWDTLLREVRTVLDAAAHAVGSP